MSTQIRISDEGKEKISKRAKRSRRSIEKYLDFLLELEDMVNYHNAAVIKEMKR